VRKTALANRQSPARRAVPMELLRHVGLQRGVPTEVDRTPTANRFISVKTGRYRLVLEMVAMFALRGRRRGLVRLAHPDRALLDRDLAPPDPDPDLDREHLDQEQEEEVSALRDVTPFLAKTNATPPPLRHASIPIRGSRNPARHVRVGLATKPIKRGRNRKEN